MTETDSERNYRNAMAMGSQQIVSGVGVAVAHARLGSGDDLASKVLTAMTQAVEDAQAAGVTDPDQIRAFILAARDRVRESHASKAG